MRTSDRSICVSPPITTDVAPAGRASAAAPIAVEARAWGALLVVRSTRTEPLPADSEARLEVFTDLVATAISNAQARADVQRLAHEPAALRRVATLVARESLPAESSPRPLREQDSPALVP